MQRYAAILAGGGGTRLWPASRRRTPKQYLNLGPSGQSLIRATFDRVEPLCTTERTFVVTTRAQIDDVRRELPELPRENIIAEPVPRNTAPAIGLATKIIRARSAEAVIGVFPSDQFIANANAFTNAAQTAYALAEDGAIATLGIPPTRPETGFGYLALSREKSAANSVREVVRFVEKPTPERAREFLAAGDFVWNAGMFFFQASRMLSELQRHLPHAFDLFEPDERYQGAPSISIDYAVMEKTPGLKCVLADCGWNDIGSWQAMSDVHRKDNAGNVSLVSSAILKDVQNSVFYSPDKLIAAIGVSDVVVVAVGDAVLICSKDRAQEVKNIVAELEASPLDRYL